MADVPWLQPYPDRLLDEIPAPAERPDEVVVARETVSLAFIAALQVLPARQRAALISRDVLGWSAARTAELLQTSVALANSALQRARSTMAGHLPADRSDWPAGQPDRRERALLERFIDAHERPGDTQFRGFKLDVLRIADGQIAEITTFGYALFAHFGLPATA